MPEDRSESGKSIVRVPVRALMCALWVHWSAVIVTAESSAYPLLLTSWLFLPFLCAAAFRCLARSDVRAWMITVNALVLSLAYALLSWWFAPPTASWTTHLLLWPVIGIVPLVHLHRTDGMRAFGVLHIGALGESFEAWEAFDTLARTALASLLAPLVWAGISSAPMLFYAIAHFGRRPPPCHSFLERFAPVWWWLNGPSLAVGTPLLLLTPKRTELPPVRELYLAGLVLAASLHLVMAVDFDELALDRTDRRFDIDPNLVMTVVLASSAVFAITLAIWLRFSKTGEAWFDARFHRGRHAS